MKLYLFQQPTKHKYNNTNTYITIHR